MRYPTLPRPVGAALLLWLAPAGLVAQPHGGWMLGQGGGVAAADPDAGLVVETVEPDRPFVVGRDTLAFPNPGGALSVGGIAGNCYTMAWTAKLFHRAARFEAGGAPRFRLDDVARSLEDDAFPMEAFRVQGAASLHELSSPPEVIGPWGAEGWLEGALRNQAGLGPAVRPEPPGHLLELYRLLSVVHYLHYVQNQYDRFAEYFVGHRMNGGASREAITAETLERVERALRDQELPIVVILNPDPDVTYGHAVLAHRLDRVRDAGGRLVRTDVHVYDSNVQFGEERRGSVLRVDAATGRHSLHLRDPETGEVEPDPRYDQAPWFAGDESLLAFFRDLEASEAVRAQLATKLRDAGQETAYLLAADTYLERSTGVSPDESSLGEDLRGFLLDLQAAADALGVDTGLPARITPEGGRRELNDFFEQVGPETLRRVAPRLLPEGLEIDRFSLRFAPWSRLSVATLQLGLRVDGSRPLARTLHALRRSALLAGLDGLEQVLSGALEVLGDRTYTVDARLRITKGESVDPRLGRFGPRVEVEGVRVMDGDYVRPDEPVERGEFHLGVSTQLLEAALRTLLTETDVLGVRKTLPYDGVDGRREARLTLDAVEVVCTPERIRLKGRGDGFVESARIPGEAAARGWSVETRADQWIEMDLVPLVDEDGFLEGDGLRVEAEVRAPLEVDDGLGGLSNGFVSGAAEAVFPVFEGWIEDELTVASRRVVTLGKGERVEFDEVDVDTWLKEVDVTTGFDPVGVDLGRTLERLFGAEPPFAVERLQPTWFGVEVHFRRR